jgi:hypothetical protein
LLINAITKKILATILMFMEVLGNSKLTPMVTIRVIARNKKLPALKSILFVPI